MTATATKSPTPSAAPMAELDLDAFLRSHGADSSSPSASDDDDVAPASARRRTVDEILNSSDDSSADHEAPPLGSRDSRRSLSVHWNPVAEPAPSSVKAISPEAPRRRSADLFASPPITTTTTTTYSSSSVTLSSLVLRSFSDGASTSSSRPLPPLFRGVRPNPKPGAALAAAAAASRSLPTPHAAAIKSRRTSSGTFQKLPESLGAVPASDALDGSEISEDARLSADLGVEQEDVVAAVSSEAEAFVLSGGLDKVHIGDELGGSFRPSSAKEAEAEEKIEAEVAVLAESIDVVGSSASDDNVCQPVDEDLQHADKIGVIAETDDDCENEVESEVPKSQIYDFSTTAFNDGKVCAKEVETQFDSVIDKVVEERLGQLESSRKAEKKAEKKLRASMTPLEWAEELEKRQASTGLHWEEGAAAQPMRLEGIRRGPPAVGYLQIDLDNTITRAFSSQTFRRDHGSPQVIAVHRNYIGLGMSRGTILVVPSKYSIHDTDNMDSKMSILGNHGDKAQTPVTSLCFNQPGDLLLVGYLDGHLTIWDVQKGTAAKVIPGEHAAPVVHTLFLGQDSQHTRQFKAVTGDSKGLVLLHTFSVVPLFNRVNIKTQCLLDGPKNGTVLSASPLLVDDFVGSGNTLSHGSSTSSNSSIGSVMGGVVGGVVGGESGWKLFNEGSSVEEEGVLIFVTHQNALVVKLSASVEFIEKFKRPDGVRDGSMPYTAWKHTVCSQNSSPGDSERVSWLAIAWDRWLQVAKLVKSEMKRYKEWDLDSAAIGVAWLDDQMLVVLTLRGQLCLFSKDGNELHKTSYILEGLGIDDIITYHTHFSNSFGNPEKAYHNSVAVRGATIYILGPMHLIVSRLLPWKERIQVLQRAGDWMGALDMAMRLYDGHSQGVIDLPKTVDAIREAIMPFLVELLLSYVDEVFSYISVAFSNHIGKGSPIHGQKHTDTEIEEQFARVGGVAVEYCVHIKRTDILFDTIFTKFVAVKQRGTFLEILEPYILKDMLGSLPPEIMQALVEHYSGQGWLQRVEQCILHMDISSLDFNQVVKLCREHGLYGALIYLFNQGLNDFRAPLEELLMVVLNSPKADASATCYRMLVYLKYCFQGQAFPPGHGTMSDFQVYAVRKELLQFLLEESKSLTNQICKQFKSSCETCPNLCYLLWMDTEATLEVLRCAFNQVVLERLDDSSKSVESSLKHEHEDKFGVLESQNFVGQNIAHTLIGVLGLENERIRTMVLDELSVWPSEKDLNHLLEFICFLVCYKHAITSPRVLKHILEYLTSTDAAQSDQNPNALGAQKEMQVLKLMTTVPDTDWNSDAVLNLCMKAHFHQACGLIYEIRGDYAAALDSYMKDLQEPVHAFAFINKVLHLRSPENVSFRSAVISRIPQLVKLSRQCTFFMVIDHFSDESRQILSELHSDPQSLFLFLKTAIDVQLSGNINIDEIKASNTTGILGDTPTNLEGYLDRFKNLPKLLNHSPIHVTDELVELYLELLCQFERTSVLKFLESFDNYRLEHCLRLCLEFGVTDAAAFLLERVGDVGGALVLVMTGLNQKIHSLITAIENAFSEMDSNTFIEFDQPGDILNLNEARTVLDVLHSSIGLCQRNTHRLDPQESELLWFQLLDSFSEPLKRFCGDKELREGDSSGKLTTTSSDLASDEDHSFRRHVKSQKCTTILRRVFSQFVGEIMEGMSGYIPLPVIMAKLLSDNGNQEFGDFKLIILRMLGTYGYEKRILDTAKSVIEDDTFYTLSLLKKGVCHALAPQDFKCCICNTSLSEDSSTASGVRIFSCGHATHLRCESVQGKTYNGESLVVCPVCLPKRSPQSRNKTVEAENVFINYPPSTLQASQGLSQHLHEPDLVERSRGLNQMTRFEILSNLQRSPKPFQVDNLPQLRLSPPAIYHEKVQKRTSLIGETSNTSAKIEKPHRLWQLKELKSKGPINRFPLKSNIFGPEKNKVR